MSQISPTTAQASREQTSSQTGSRDSFYSAQDETGLQYQPGVPLKIVHIKARVRSVTVGKPLRYNLPGEE